MKQKQIKTAKQLEKYLKANFRGCSSYKDGDDTVFTYGRNCKELARWIYEEDRFVSLSPDFDVNEIC